MNIEIEGSDKILAIAGVSEKGPQGDVGEKGARGDIGPVGIVTVHPENSLIYDKDSKVLVLNAGNFASGDLADQVVLGEDYRLSNSRNPAGAAGGDLAGTYPNPILKNITTAKTSQAIYKLTIDAKGRITASEIATAVDLNLGNVNNTSDLNKPISTETQTALNSKLNIALASSTYVPLNDSRLIKLTVQGQSTSSVRAIAASSDGSVTAGTATTAAASDHSHINFNNNISMYGNRITNLHDVDETTEGNHAVNKKYVDQTAIGLKPHTSVKLATTGSNISLSGAQKIDNVDVITNDRILVKDQNDVWKNGIYVANTSGAWSRANDMGGPPDNNVNWDQVKGAFIGVDGGSTLSGTAWLANVGNTGTIGNSGSPIAFVLFPIPVITEGFGISKLGPKISINLSQSPQYPGLDIINGLSVKASDGIQVTSDGIKVKLANANSGLQFNSGYLSVSSAIAGSGLNYTNGAININSNQNFEGGIETLGDINTGTIASSGENTSITAENIISNNDITAETGTVLASNIESTGDISGTWAGEPIGLDKGGLGNVDLSPINPASTVLARYLSANGTVAYVDSTEGYSPSGTIQISDEIISYSSIGLNENSPSFEGLTRGINATSADSHQDGAIVYDPTGRYNFLKNDQEVAQFNLGLGNLSTRNDIVFKTHQTFAIQGNILVNSDAAGLDVPSFFIMKGFPDQEGVVSTTSLSQIICKIGFGDPDTIDPYAEFTIQKIDANGIVETDAIKAFQDTQIINAVVPIWNLQNNYVVDDVVSYNGDYYQCKIITTDLTQPSLAPQNDTYHWNLIDFTSDYSIEIEDTIDDFGHAIPTELKLNVTGINGTPKNLTVTLIFEHVFTP